MTDPHLRRAVWLTAAQRSRLRNAVEKAFEENCDQMQVLALQAELILITKRQEKLEHLVRSVVRGLRMPSDVLPVHLSDAQVDELISCHLLESDLIIVLKPPPEHYHE